MNRRDFIKTAAVAAGFVPCFNSFYPPIPELADPTPTEKAIKLGESWTITGVRSYPEFNGTYRISRITEDTFTYKK